MNILITNNILSLNRLLHLLEDLSLSEYTNSTVLPYNSSIGNHTRHILDYYDCILKYDKQVDLTIKNRSCLSNTHLDKAKNRIKDIINGLQNLKYLDFNIEVYDEFGNGKVKVNYTYSSLLASAESHTTHHLATIGYLLYQINNQNNILEKDMQFGINQNTLIK